MCGTDEVDSGLWTVPQAALDYCDDHEIPAGIADLWENEDCGELAANYLVHTIAWEGDVVATHERETKGTFACPEKGVAGSGGCDGAGIPGRAGAVGPYDPCADERDAIAVFVRTEALADPDEEALAEDLKELTDADIVAKQVFDGEECTAFLVGPRHVLTVAHCMDPVPQLCGGAASNRLDDRTLLFDYVMPDPALATAVTGMTVVACGRDGSPIDYLAERDWVLIELDAPLAGRMPLALPAAGTAPAQCTTLYMLGHPLGHPQECIGTDHRARPAAWVLSDPHADGDVAPAFTTTLDVLHSLSGAPVFDFATDELVGMHREGAYIDTIGVWRSGAAECTPIEDCGEELTLGALTATLAPYLDA